MQNLQFANRTQEDVKLLCRFNEIAALMKVLDALPTKSPIKNSAAFKAIKKRGYVSVPRIVSITRPKQAEGFDGSNFSAEAIESRADEGYRRTDLALKEPNETPVLTRSGTSRDRDIIS